MSLPLPKLDDRDFNQLVEEARRHIQQACPEWTDLSPGDPGMVLLELYAYLTETLIYRLNRLPEKAYVELLRLIGVRMQPPAAASVSLRFSCSSPAERPIEIPRGTRVTIERSGAGSEPPMFTTSRTVTIPVGKAEIDVLAHHCELVVAELAGTASGLPGLWVQAQRPPIVAPTGDELDLIVGVESTPDELDEGAPVIQHEDKTYRIWRPVDSFADQGPGSYAYAVDRMAGTITFAPAVRMQREDGELEEVPRALAQVPPPGREIRLWYRRGGGASGNVAAGTLTMLKDPIPGVKVMNPEPATGGQSEEALQNALVRGPQELHSLHRAVTASDFESVAMHNSRSVARAKALTRAALWAHATPGTVEVLLVPHVPAEERGLVTASALQGRETEAVRSQIQRALDERRPLGITCLANWVRYKAVRVRARVVVRREANRTEIRRRVLERLRETINPLPTQYSLTGWPFGQALRASHVYDIALAEPGVLWADRVRLLVDEVPDRAVSCIVADAFQPRTWYAASGPTLFRSLNDGEGWESAGRFADEQIELVCIHPARPGLLAVVTQWPDPGGSRIHISRDCGESWDATPYSTAFEVNDVALTLRNDAPVLLLATDLGLYELVLRPGGSPVQLLVDPTDQERGFCAVVASRDVRGETNVALASEATGGVYLSSAGGRSNTFRPIGLQGEDVRVLAVQHDGPRSFLWAGTAAAGGSPGKGCFRWELRGAEDPAEGWRPYGEGWTGGSCRGLAFSETQVLAASYRAGVLRLDAGARSPTWEAPGVNCGLPLRDPGDFYPVTTVAADPVARLVMAGSVEGVCRSQDQGATYAASSEVEFSDRVMLPPTWLFCSGEHEVAVVSEDEADRD